MVRIAIVAVIAACAFVVACGNTESQRTPDGQIDAPPPEQLGSGSGSGSDELAMEPSPRERGLELIVVASSLVLVVGPVIGSRRRRTPNIL